MLAEGLGASHRRLWSRRPARPRRRWGASRRRGAQLHSQMAASINWGSYSGAQISLYIYIYIYLLYIDIDIEDPIIVLSYLPLTSGCFHKLGPHIQGLRRNWKATSVSQVVRDHLPFVAVSIN